MLTAQLPLLDKALLAVTGIYTLFVGGVIVWLFGTHMCSDCRGNGHLDGKTCCGCAGRGTVKL